MAPDEPQLGSCGSFAAGRGRDAPCRGALANKRRPRRRQGYGDSRGASVSSHVRRSKRWRVERRTVAPEINRPARFVDVARTARLVEACGHLRRSSPGSCRRITKDGGGADIGELMKKGVPGIAHRTVGTHYFDWHHTPADMLDKVDPVELRKNVAALAVIAWVLADMPGRLTDPTGGEPAIGARETR